MLDRVKAHIICHPVTPSLAVVMGGVFIIEQIVLSISRELVEFMFIGQGQLTPGLLLSPLSHGTLLTHFLPNMALLFAVGWPLEAHLKRRDFILFTALTAYVPTYLQIGYSVVSTGTAGTLGFSGAIFAYPPALMCSRFSNRSIEQFGSGGYYAIALTIVIPLLLSGQFDYLSPLPGADVTHTVGYLFGWIYGILLLVDGF